MAAEFILPEKDEIRKTYDSYTPVFSAILSNVEKKVKEDIVLNPRPVIKTRIKSFNSYYHKLLRLKAGEASSSKKIVCLTDMIGIRVVCAFMEDVVEVEKQLKAKYSVREVEHKGASQSFREFGYESTHVLIEIPEDCLNLEGVSQNVINACPIPENLVCEIQIRTILQDAWAEVEHELIYKTEFTPFDAPLRRKLAAVNASLSLADITFQEIRDYQKNLQKEVDERRSAFYEKADFVADSGLNIASKKKEDKKDSIDRISPYVHGTIDDMILHAIHAHNEGNIDEAVEIYSEILNTEEKLDDNVLSVIYKHRGMAQFAQNKYYEALEDFNESAKYGKNNFRAVYYQGIVYNVLGDNDKAIDCYTTSLEMNQFQSHAFFRRALSYYNKGDYQNSLKDLTAAKKLGLDSEEANALNEQLVKKFDMGM